MLRSIAIRIVLFAVVFAPGADAQCTAVPGTGCGPGGFCVGSTAIGATLRLHSVASYAFGVLLGQCQAPPYPVLGPPIMCQPGCSVGVVPSTIIPMIAFGWLEIRIPFDPNLIGTTWCLQQHPLPGPSCFQFLSPALRFTIMP